jgi:hypothetical protein
MLRIRTPADTAEGVNMLRIFTKPTRKLKGGQYAPDLFTSFLNFRGSTSAGLS